MTPSPVAKLVEAGMEVTTATKKLTLDGEFFAVCAMRFAVPLGFSAVGLWQDEP